MAWDPSPTLILSYLLDFLLWSWFLFGAKSPDLLITGSTFGFYLFLFPLKLSLEFSWYIDLLKVWNIFGLISSLVFWAICSLWCSKNDSPGFLSVFISQLRNSFLILLKASLLLSKSVRFKSISSVNRSIVATSQTYLKSMPLGESRSLMYRAQFSLKVFNKSGKIMGKQMKL
jgi:hypothetical protein